MKIKELRSKNSSELDTMYEEMKKELIKLNAQVATGTTLKSPGKIKQIKKNIARILTIKNQTKNE
ncbi:MAG: 50S ribosomal protein L29 [Nanoarchaeota archaeon]|nr:50S ribosomal protein L29 [Nanoarchaeota archaeon]